MKQKINSSLNISKAIRPEENTILTGCYWMELYSVAETYSHQYKNMFVDIALYDATMRGATKIVIFLKVLMKAAVQKKGIQVTTFLTKTVWHGLKIQGQKTVKQTYMDERSQGLPTGIYFFLKKY